MKQSPKKVSDLLSDLGICITHWTSTECIDGDFDDASQADKLNPAKLSHISAILDELFQSVELNVGKALGISAIKNSLDSHLHVGAFRKLPEEAISKRSLPVNAASTPWHNLLENQSGFRVSEKPQSMVNKALVKLNIPYQVATRELFVQAYRPIDDQIEDQLPREDWRYIEEELVFVDKSGCPHSIQSLGSGIGVIVPVVVALSTTDTEFLSIEEPESHVHPRLQAELGDVVITAASGTRKRTLHIETHSEHLLLRIMRRMRQTYENRLPEEIPFVRQNDVALLFVSPGKSNSGELQGSVVQEIGLNERGELIKGWPGGFFEEGFNEMFD